MAANDADARYWVPFQIERPGLHYSDTSYGVRYSNLATINDDEYHAPGAPARSSMLLAQTLRGEIESAPLSDVADAILDMASVRYLMINLWPEEYISRAHAIASQLGWRLVQENDRVALLENSDVLPRAQAFTTGRPAPRSEDELPAALAAARAMGYVLVESPLQPERAGASLSALEPAEPANVQLTYRRPSSNRIFVDYESRSAFFLFVSESWYPHWRVSRSGEQLELLRMNGAFLGTYVSQHAIDGQPKGTIAFTFRQPWYVWFGCALSAVTSVFILIVLCRAWSHRRAGGSPSPARPQQ